MAYIWGLNSFFGFYTFLHSVSVESRLKVILCRHVDTFAYYNRRCYCQLLYSSLRFLKSHSRLHLQRDHFDSRQRVFIMALWFS